MIDRMLRPREVTEKTGSSRTTIYRGVRDGTFPPPTQLGENSIGWPESVIDAYLASLPRRTYGAKVPYKASENAPPAPPTAPADKDDDNRPFAAA